VSPLKHVPPPSGIQPCRYFTHYDGYDSDTDYVALRRQGDDRSDDTPPSNSAGAENVPVPGGNGVFPSPLF
jgi:hypothetical protein